MVGGAGAASLIGWQSDVSLRADELRKSGKACILLWMDGGPSHFETFDPKPGTRTGGPTQAWLTTIPGVQYSQNLPALAAKAADKLCVIRSMTSKEGDHYRATYLSQTGYLPTPAIKHPAFGAHVAMQLGSLDSELPSFVSLGDLERSPAAKSIGGGFFGANVAPFYVAAPGMPPDNVAIRTSEERFRRRMSLLSRVDREFEENGAGPTAVIHRDVCTAAARMALSPTMSAFDVSQEPMTTRAAYGQSEFGQGCLVARRLLEAGVPFVQVTLPGWDTHNKCFETCQKLGGQLDHGFSALLSDLEQRGMLDSTLVIWMGEFGRTPEITRATGRGHHPDAYSAAMAGCGVKGGQIIGATCPLGAEVVDRPVSVPDVLRTAATALGLDPDLEHETSVGRPIVTLDGGTVLDGVLG